LNDHECQAACAITNAQLHARSPWPTSMSQIIGLFIDYEINFKTYFYKYLINGDHLSCPSKTDNWVQNKDGDLFIVFHIFALQRFKTRSIDFFFEDKMIYSERLYRAKN
jgi:hypothetical protein